MLTVKQVEGINMEIRHSGRIEKCDLYSLPNMQGKLDAYTFEQNRGVMSEIEEHRLFHEVMDTIQNLTNLKAVVTIGSKRKFIFYLK